MRRAALLLEVTLALAIFVMAGLAIGSAMGQGLESVTRTQHQHRAIDLTRSAMSLIEAGIADPNALQGPLVQFATDPDEDPEAGLPGMTFDDDPELWQLRIEVDPSELRGLSLVAVTAERFAVIDGQRPIATHTLRQLVRLGDAIDDTVGDIDDLQREAERGSRLQRRRDNSQQRLQDRESQFEGVRSRPRNNSGGQR